MPLAYLMGVEWADCGIVGELIGIKSFLNEFLAYGELSTYLDNRKHCTGRMLAVGTVLNVITNIESFGWSRGRKFIK